MLIAAAGGARVHLQEPSRAEFVGTIPCGEAVRAFVGGLSANAACHAITWQLILRGAPNAPGQWNLTAVYGVPPPNDPNQMVEGPRVTLDGVLEKTSRAKADIGTFVYRLVSNGSQKSLSLAEINDSILHVLAVDGRLMPGTSGWSYTLSHAGRVDSTPPPGSASDMSYTISPKGTGSTVFGVFEGRTPCPGIARELGLGTVPGCTKVKWRVTLYQDAKSQPAAYKVEGSLHRQQPREGTWRIVRGTPAYPNATVYRLDAAGTEAPLMFIRGDEDVLFFLDKHSSLLVGTKDFGYTLNRAR